MKTLEEILQDHLHTVTLYHEGQPNEPHRQVIFKEDIPVIVDMMKILKILKLGDTK